MAKSGVRIKISKDKKTITTWTYPLVSGQNNNLTKMTWKNYCTSCKTNATLELYTTSGGKSRYFGGAIRCKRCGKIFCGVTGWTENRTLKLIPATRNPNEVSRVALSEVESAQCTLSRASALTKAKQGLKTGSTYKGSLEIPILPNLNVDEKIQVSLPGFSSKTSVIDQIKENIDKQTYTLSLTSGATNYGSNYSGKYIMTKNGKLVASSGKNPLQAKCSKVNLNTGIKAESEIAKRIMLKGRALGSIDKIYKWLKVTAAGGQGGWKYLKYENHAIKSSTADTTTTTTSTSTSSDNAEAKKAEMWDDKSAAACWKVKKANCCDFAWIFFMMTRGAGTPAGIKKGTYTNLSGNKQGHMWNYYKSKNYDCSSVQTVTIDLKKVETVTKDSNKKKKK